jgi:polysaccharide deacetylase 2 family uncharacterized protein YibQ
LNSNKTPRQEPKKKRGAGKGRKGKKLTLGDKIRAVLVTAVLVALVAAVSAAFYFFTRPGSGGNGAGLALEREEARPPAEKVSSTVLDGPSAKNVRRQLNEPPANAAVIPADAAALPAAVPAAPVQAADKPPAGAAPAAVPVQVETKPPVSRRPEQEAPAPPARPEQALPVQAAAVERPPEEPRRRGILVIVIDDAGNNLESLDAFLSFPGPLTMAVLPRLPHSAETARRIRAAGKEVILHQPMEAQGSRNPGPGAVFAGMGSEEIRGVINRNLDEIWPVAGLNNHEGSRVTMDREAMETVLGLCKERGILFLDSRTTAKTAAPEAARKLGIKIGERDIFLDNSQEKDSMLHYLNLGLRRAEEQGAAVMIGHTWSPALGPLLTELYQDLIARGYRFSTLSEFLNRNF